MAFGYDGTTNRISMPPGDTGDLWIEVEWGAMADTLPILTLAIGLVYHIVPLARTPSASSTRNNEGDDKK